nr:DNA topoisomerase IB [Acidobacteriota bacterium]
MPATAAASAPAVAGAAVPNPVESARAAGLRYTADTKPGIRRERTGKEFNYLTPDGR